MKGIINKGIQEMAETLLGADAWTKIKSKAGCEEPFFAVSQDYPDEMTIALATAASEVSGMSVDEVMFEYGKFIVPNSLKKQYPAYYALAGNSAQEFLCNMDTVHENVTRNIPNASPPRFEYEQTPDGKLLMHYKSDRGLCSVLRGLIAGVGDLFEEELEIRETACGRNGASHCTFEVSF